MTRRHWHSIRLAAAARILALLTLPPAGAVSRTAPCRRPRALGGDLGRREGRRAEGLPAWTVTVVEPLAVGVACGLTPHGSTAVLGALVVAPVHGRAPPRAPRRRAAFCVGLGATLVAAWLTGGLLSGTEARVIVSISVTGLGLGCIATFLRSALRRTPTRWRRTATRRR